MSPFPNYLSMQGITSTMKDVIGYCYEKILLTFENGMMHCFWGKEDSERVKQLALEKAKNNPSVIKELIEKVEKLGIKFIEFTKNIHNSKLKEKPNKELLELYKKYCRDYKQIYSTYFVILTMENSLLDYLENYLNSKDLDEERKSRYLSVLTTSTKAMFTKEETKELLKIAVDIQEQISRRIKKHTDKYFWLNRDYEDPISTEKDFFAKLDKFVKIDKTIKERFEETEQFYIDQENKIREIEKELDMDEFHAKLFELMRDGIYLKELRKKLVSESLYYMDRLLIEIGRRYNLTLKQMRLLIIDEVEKMIEDNIDYSKIIDSRMKLSVYLAENGKTKVYDGEEAEKIKKQAIKVDENTKEFRGLGVSPGKAKGPVKVVFDPSDIGKVKPGDVMVTVQAVPSFTPGIKIAAALIADGGTGVTSHPATLAREAGIPGVTGVKIATEVLKDGDMVEVDGNKGIVRRL